MKKINNNSSNGSGQTAFYTPQLPFDKNLPNLSDYINDNANSGSQSGNGDERIESPSWGYQYNPNNSCNEFFSEAAETITELEWNPIFMRWMGRKLEKFWDTASEGIIRAEELNNQYDMMLFESGIDFAGDAFNQHMEREHEKSENIMEGVQWIVDAKTNLNESVATLNQVEPYTYTEDLPDGVMAVAEKVRSSGAGHGGIAIVYDEEKYARYIIVGLGYTKGSIIPAVPCYTTGIADVVDIEDYSNAFITIGSQAITHIDSVSSWATNKGSTTYSPEFGATPGTSFGGSFSWYIPIDEEWIYYEELPEGFMYRDDVIDEIMEMYPYIGGN